jgi:S-adenosylmethionine hydrolase
MGEYTPAPVASRGTMPHRPTITLLTDFGLAGIYVGALHGVILARCPDAAIIDLTHQVSPQAVREGAFLLAGAYPYCPPGSIHVAVVDPGVGTTRRALALRVPGTGVFIGPDNGLFTPILAAHPTVEARAIANPDFTLAGGGGAISATFHGRDIFAPAAARLAGGADFDAIGPPLAPDTLVRLPRFRAMWDDTARRGVTGEIVHIDGFGNLVTNIPRQLFADIAPERLTGATVTGAGHTCRGLVATYGDAPTGSIVALFDSGGFLEFARVSGRADRDGAAAIALGTAVTLRLP